MAKFRCKASGGIIELFQEHDIEQVRMQEDYEEVIEEPVKKKTVKKVMSDETTISGE